MVREGGEVTEGLRGGDEVLGGGDLDKGQVEAGGEEVGDGVSGLRDNGRGEGEGAGKGQGRKATGEGECMVDGKGEDQSLSRSFMKRG